MRGNRLKQMVITNLLDAIGVKLNYCIMKTIELERILKNSDCLMKFKYSEYGKLYSLKSLFNIYLEHLIDDETIEKVSLSDYVKIEDCKIPLFVESQFGNHPNLKELFIDDADRIIAIIHKARYSAFVFSLNIYHYKKNNKIEIVQFKNEKK